MNWINLLFLFVVLLAMWIGWKKGFIRGVLDLFTWYGSIVIGLLFYPYIAKGMAGIADIGVWLLPVSFLFTVVFLRIIAGLLTGKFLQLLPEKIKENGINKFFGIVPGFINGLICSTIIAALFLALPIRNRISDETRHSKLAMGLATKAEWANKKLAPVFDEAVRQTMSSLNLQKESHEAVTLHFTYDDPEVRPLLEAKMLDLVNAERAKEGLKPLKPDRELTLVARKHSKDMFARGYFAHENPEGKDPFDRMADAHIKFKVAGENLALAQTLELAHKNLMNSPGHRANIMNPSFGRIGIGIQDGGFYGLMISQEFRD